MYHLYSVKCCCCYHRCYRCYYFTTSNEHVYSQKCRQGKTL